MYGKNDIFRIKDIVHSMDDNHWRGKQWLADVVKNHHRLQSGYTDYGSILVMGGWYGLMAYQLRKVYPDPHMKIISVDMDPRCEELGYKIFYDQNISFVTSDVKDVALWDHTIVVNTSVEHMARDNIVDLMANKDPNTLVALQSNDYYDELSHINCDESVQEFVEWITPSLSEDSVRYFGTMQMSTFKRFLVVGK